MVPVLSAYLKSARLLYFSINHNHTQVSKGGSTTEDNLVLQCPHCSLHKADKSFGTDPAEGEPTLLFDPLGQFPVE